jgi:hypothetical protein
MKSSYDLMPVPNNSHQRPKGPEETSYGWRLRKTEIDVVRSE